MQLPESISNLTTEVPSSFTHAKTEKKLEMDDFIQCIEQALTADLKKFFDKGYNFYKISGTDSTVFLKNLFDLIIDFYKTILHDSSIEVEKQEAIAEHLTLILKNIENNFLVFDNLLNSLKINKKTFDSNKLFMIITGYAINNLKKNYNR